ncbi:protein SPMIP2 [Mirounga angustirostris]|uniref:protein SPMIP2 n=1 Tax=Mirounga angustirostris TaxID=9716 RepID=UPI00313BE3AE
MKGAPAPGGTRVTSRPQHSFCLQCLWSTSGPDYIKDHLTKVHQHTSYIGEKLPALEKTGDLRYLWRPAPNRSLPAKYKYEYVGEVGWGIPEYDFINQTRLQTGFQIKCGELNQATIDKISHRYQNPWQPKPDIMDMQGKYSRGFIAWHMGNYENTNERNSKGAVLVRQSTAALPRASRSPKLPKLPRKEEVRSFAFLNHHRKQQIILT